MKIRNSIVGFVAIITLLALLVIWFGKQPKKTSGGATTESNPESKNDTLETQLNTRATYLPSNHLALIAIQQTNTVRKSKEQETLEVLSTQNDVPIVFYGRLEDQFGSPVSGAQIAAGVRIYNGIRSTVERFSIASDGNGFFQINHGKGESLGILPSKTGYALATTGTSFKYSHLENHPYVSDQNNPTVIKMWKLQGAEPLVGIGKEYKLHYTNAPIYFDLLAGEIVSAGGDIKLTVNRSSGVISGRSRLDWSVQIEVIDGGLMDSGGQEEVTFAAPEDGYQSIMTFIFSTNAPYKWTEGFDQGFFVKSRNGQVYSKLGLGFGINRNPDDFMHIMFGGVANTNSSRNWEATAPQQ